ncbi:hypothetical protein EX895_006357 [Sporisorium graminicola]|uniref:Fibronectin type-III domain-containing protein n=1 Tax=Sporisorium graminicola TaxID=280036 RepID=A0A4U7KN55_9BASI|nr:hypothetical protein EX895_006357 [Sporisorium graminicola]TKY85277.1 hypothetical protein EX895_006357 [Sporisorium graminicola]
MWSLCVPLLAALTLLALSTSISAFPLNVTVSQQCTPLNVTWKAVPERFPYTIWIAANHGFVQTYRINSDYQPGAQYITFQFIVPPPSGGFTSYTVTVGDSRGDGNTTQALPINTPSSSSSNCPAFAGSAAFQYAADPRNGSMIQCGAVHFYNIGDRGTRPFTISFLPLGGTPVSVQVPDRSTLNTSNFDYLTLVPFAQGTQFQTVLGDASDPGSGGASAIFTVGPSSLTPCLAENYRLPDRLSVALPIASNVATYSNLAGAISTSAPPRGSESNPTGAIAGGAIGGAIALGVAIGCLVAFLLYRRRQKTKRNLARSEEVHFVDLDSDDGDEWAAARPSRSSRRNGNSPAEEGTTAGRSYAVSPFVYEPRHHTGSSGRGNGQSLEMTSPHSTNPSYGELLNAAGISSSAGVSPSDDYPPRAGNVTMHSHHSSQVHNPFSSSYAAFSSGSHAESSGATLHAAAAATSTSSKAQAAAAQARREQRAPRRVVQHTDGGALPQPSSDTEDEDVVDELPPEYGGWLQNGGAGGSSSAQAAGHAPIVPSATQTHHGGGAAGYDAPRGAF